MAMRCVARLNAFSTTRSFHSTSRSFHSTNRSLGASLRAALSPTGTVAPTPPAAQSATEDVAIEESKELLFKGIKSIGYSDEEAYTMRDAMMWAQLVTAAVRTDDHPPAA
jgi:hypothetical protein